MIGITLLWLPTSNNVVQEHHFIFVIFKSNKLSQKELSFKSLRHDKSDITGQESGVRRASHKISMRKIVKWINTNVVVASMFRIYNFGFYLNLQKTICLCYTFMIPVSKCFATSLYPIRWEVFYPTSKQQFVQSAREECMLYYDTLCISYKYKFFLSTNERNKAFMKLR